MLQHFNNLKNCFHELNRLSSMDNCTAEELNAAMLSITPSGVDQFMIKDVLNALYLAQREITLVAPYLGLFIVNAQGKCLFELMSWNIYLIDNKFSAQPKGMSEIVASLAAAEKSVPRPEYNRNNDRGGRGGYTDRGGRGGHMRENTRGERGGYFPREPRGAEPTNPSRNMAYAVVNSDNSGTPSVLERINQSRPDPRANAIYSKNNYERNAPVSKYDKNKERNAAKKTEKKSKNETKNATLPTLSNDFLTGMLTEITKESDQPKESDE